MPAARPRPFRRHRIRAGLGLVAAAGLAVPGAALADSASISVADPSAEIASVYTLNYQTAVPTRVYVKYRPTGGQPCAPTAVDDPGSWLYWDGLSISGAGTAQASWRFGRAGQYQVCFWLADGYYELPRYTTSQIMSVRSPRGSLQITAPPNVAPGVQTTFTLSGETEVDRYAYLKYRPSGGQPCAPTAADDPGSSLAGIYSDSARGAFTVSGTASFTKAGSYLLCAWLASDSDESPTAATGTTITVTAPPPPDADADGVPDTTDRCRTSPGPSTATGCPVVPLRLVSLSVHGRRLSVSTELPAAGTLVVRLERRGSSQVIPVMRTRVTAARRHSFSWMLPRRYARGRFSVVSYFAPMAGDASRVTRGVRLG